MAALSRALAVAALLLLCVSPRVYAQLPPDVAWRTIQSQHFRITYSPGLDELARHTAARAEVAHAVLEAELGRAPRRRIEILLTGEADVANGYASPFPQNRIVLFAHPPLNVFALEYQADWIDLLVTHELTHILHLDRTSPVGGVLRAVFGRVPAGWPFFPVLFTPTWSIEGLAVQAESHLTGMGRLHGSFHEMALRAAVLENQFDPLDRVSNHSPLWPDGQRPYIYGSLFMDFLQRRHGDDAPARILEATARSWLPPPLHFNAVGRRALGESFLDSYDEWLHELRSRYTTLADSLRRAGLTPSDRVVGHGRYALTPRVSLDGTRVAYAAGDGRDALMTRVVDATGARLWQQRRSSLGPASWLPDGTGLVTSQLEFHGPWRLFEDLYLVTPGGEFRLTAGHRLQWPDVARDGRSVVAIQSRGDTNRPVVFDMETGEIEPVIEYAADVHWMYPRWAPDATRIAISRWRRGGSFELVVIDRHGRVLHELTDDAAIDGSPSWSPDGRFVVFSSDRTGIPNLYAAELVEGGGARLHQMSNVLTGAFQPDVAPDGRTVVYVGYHGDGFHIERMPFDPAAWRPAPPYALDRIAAARAPGLSPDTLRRDERISAIDTTTSWPATYRSWPTLLPRYWVPSYRGDGVVGHYFGVTTSGTDLVGRHGYFVTALVEPQTGRWQGSATWEFAGLGAPIVGVAASRDWDNLGPVTLSAGDTTVRRTLREREDVATVSLRFVRPRMRSAASVSLGGEYVIRVRELLGTPALRLVDDRDALAGPVLRAFWTNARRPAFAISSQDGFTVSAIARRRWQTGSSTGDVDDGYAEVTTQANAYRSHELFGFARHVLALRGAALWRDGAGAPLTGVGGVTGERLLAVRGYGRNARLGTTGWSASAEYRMPLALVGRGPGLVPVFLDRLSLGAFVDAGDIRCNPDVAELRPTACAPREGMPDAVLVGAGGELVVDGMILFSAPLRLRLGAAAPLRGATANPRFYVQTGLGF